MALHAQTRGHRTITFQKQQQQRQPAAAPPYRKPSPPWPVPKMCLARQKERVMLLLLLAALLRQTADASQLSTPSSAAKVRLLDWLHTAPSRVKRSNLLIMSCNQRDVLWHRVIYIGVSRFRTSALCLYQLLSLAPMASRRQRREARRHPRHYSNRSHSRNGVPLQTS